MTADDPPVDDRLAKLDTNVAHSARLRNHLLGGSQWRPDGNDTTPASEYAGVARKPA
jgi:hypothetical protein